MNIRDVLQKIKNNAFTKTFQKLYGTSEDVLQHQKQRYLDALHKFTQLYPKRKAIRIYSAPAERRSAATTPTTSTDVCWRRL